MRKARFLGEIDLRIFGKIIRSIVTNQGAWATVPRQLQMLNHWARMSQHRERPTPEPKLTSPIFHAERLMEPTLSSNHTSFEGCSSREKDTALRGTQAY